jgi:hypothetical protein
MWEWLTLKNKHEFRSFLGLCTYYRWFISSFVNNGSHLPNTEAMCTVPIYAYPQPRERFIVDTDASNVGIGGVLSQVQDR